MADYLFLALVPVIAAVVIQWLTQHTRLTPWFVTYTGVVGPFFVAIAILFALFANFLVSDVWIKSTDRNVAREQSLEREMGALQSIRKLSNGLGENGVAVTAEIDDYLSLSSAEARTGNGDKDAAIDAKLQQIVSAVVALQTETNSTKAAQTVMLQSFRELEFARAERRPIPVVGNDHFKWFTVIALGILTQAALALVHIDHRKAQAASLFIFTLSFILVLIVIRISERKIAALAMP